MKKVKKKRVSKLWVGMQGLKALTLRIFSVIFTTQAVREGREEQAVLRLIEEE